MSDPTAPPQISVVIPAYNAAPYLARAVESVLLQTGVVSEVVIVDDGSRDETPAIAAACLRVGGDRARSVRQENQGVSAARNRGLALARGEAVAFLDADDWFLPGKLAAQWAILADRPEIDFVHSGWQRTDAAGNALGTVEPWHRVPDLDLEAWLRWKPVGTTGAFLFRRSPLERAGGFQPGLAHGEDVDLILRLAAAGSRATWLRQITVAYRQHDRSAMRDGRAQARDINAVLDRFFARDDLPDSIRAIAPEVRYNTLIWSAWYLLRTGCEAEMADYLARSLDWRDRPLPETVAHWLESFEAFSQEIDFPFDAETVARSEPWKAAVAAAADRLRALALA